MSKFSLFKPSYTDRKTGKARASATYHVRFRDHQGRRQTYASGTREKDASSDGERMMQLVRCRRTAEPMEPSLSRWVESRDPQERRRLLEMDLIDPMTVDADTPLIAHLRGMKDGDGKVIEPGFEQHLLSKGNTAGYVEQTAKRVETLIDACGFIYWKDLARAAAVTRIGVYLGEQRAGGKLSGATANYYMRDMQSFCRWLAKTRRAPTIALAGLERLNNTDVDSRVYRALTIEEMQYLLPVVAEAPSREGLTGDERAILYRYSFETGMRPGQTRQLLVSNFKFPKDGGATVTSAAGTVKRRKVHTQGIKPGLAAELKERFKSKLPSAPAFRMPSKYHQADMLRWDLAAAREQWLNAEGLSDEEREDRQRSDFLAAVNHAGEHSVFYSTRHGHGTALAEAGASDAEIGASMHHTNPKTTQRYIHSLKKRVANAVSMMTDLSYVQRQKATGTDGKVDPCLRSACADERTQVDSVGQIDVEAATLADRRKRRK